MNRLANAAAEAGSALSQPPWATRADQVLAQLEVDVQEGLRSADIPSRRARYGANELLQEKKRHAWRILLNQFRSLVVLLLVAAAAVSLVLGDFVEAVAVLVVIGLNTALGFFTELKAVRSMDALRELGRVVTSVRRNATLSQVAAEDLVPGDIVIIEAGDIVTADLRIVEASRLGTDESALTGESVPVNKTAEPVPADTHLAERTNMLHKGTVVTRGSAVAVVCATGRNTEVGRIAKLVEGAQPDTTPLERRLARLGRRLVWLTLSFVVAVNLFALWAGRDMALTIKTSIALAVAAIPEGLPIVATLALARGMWHMAARNALISRLSAVETLGTTSVLLSDKTGTLTENRMAVQKVLLANGDEPGCDPTDAAELGHAKPVSDPNLQALLTTMTLCNSASIDGPQPVGDPTETALLTYARACGLERAALLANWPQTNLDAFDSERQMMATVHQAGSKVLVAVKGAPEAVVAGCTQLAGAASGATVAMDEVQREAWLAHSKRMAGEGLRMLALAGKDSDDGERRYCDLTLYGLVGLWDPPRSDVSDAIARLRRAGIRVVMVTGDHPATASHIARAVGIVDDDDRGVIDAREFESVAQLPAAEQDRLLQSNVIARSSPQQKLDLIQLHQKAGHIVAMTGDGVNDAPALKRADIGIAMGLRGTPVARQAAAMILRDDRLSTIVEAVRGGRMIYTNIRRFVLYLLSCNLSEILVVGLATIVGAPSPLTPLQILFLNLVTDVFPALALGVTPADPGILQQPPRAMNEALITRRHWWAIALHAATISTVVLVVLALALTRWQLSPHGVTTATFCTLALAQIWHVFNMRERAVGRRAATLHNPWVWAAVVLCLLILAAALWLQPVAEVLALTSLPVHIWGWILGLSLVPLLVGGVVVRLAVRFGR
jgi:Ca2+-transporting ATPase